MKPRSLAGAVEFYLKERRQLGFPLKEDGQMLRQLVGYAAHRQHRGPLTRQLALAWAQSPTQASRLWWARRLDVARRFATFWSAFDPRTEIPPAGVFGPAYRRRAVHLYAPEEITALMEAAGGLGGLRGLTFQTLLGLLACTGLRIGEALRLQTQDIDWTAGLLTVRHSKFRRSRSVPLQDSSLAALKLYRQWRQKYYSQTDRGFFFWGQNGRPISYGQAAATFGFLRQQLGWKQTPVPRLHDLRHAFAVRSLMEGYRRGETVAKEVLYLATYLGHSNIRDTYWYLSAVPELLALAQARWPEPTLWQGGSHA
jgi:integrase